MVTAPGCTGSVTGSNANPSHNFAYSGQPVTPGATSENATTTRHTKNAFQDRVTDVTGCLYVSALTRVSITVLVAHRDQLGKTRHPSHPSHQASP